jgi:hypothetical protein
MMPPPALLEMCTMRLLELPETLMMRLRMLLGMPKRESRRLPRKSRRSFRLAEKRMRSQMKSSTYYAYMRLSILHELLTVHVSMAGGLLGTVWARW